jgi:hypothetical protein
MTDPGTTRDTDRLADAVLRAMEHDLARPDRDDVASNSSAGSIASRSRAEIWNWTNPCCSSPTTASA